MISVFIYLKDREEVIRRESQFIFPVLAGEIMTSVLTVHEDRWRGN